MKKILLMLFALMFIGGQASATKTYATWGTPASNGAWEATTDTYSWIAATNNLATIFETPNGSLAQYKSIHLTTSNYVDGSPYRICLMKGTVALVQIPFYSEGQKDIVFSEREETKDLDLSEVTHISFGGASESGSITVQNVYLEKPLELTYDNTGAATIGLTDLKAEGSFSLDDKTGVLTCSGDGWGRLSVVIPSGSSLDLSNLARIELLYEGEATPTIIGSLIVANATENVCALYNTPWGRDFTDEYRAKAANVTSIYWAASSHSSS